jgi:hypothetical protein
MKAVRSSTHANCWLGVTGRPTALRIGCCMGSACKLMCLRLASATVAVNLANDWVVS